MLGAKNLCAALGELSTRWQSRATILSVSRLPSGEYRNGLGGQAKMYADALSLASAGLSSGRADAREAAGLVRTAARFTDVSACRRGLAQVSDEDLLALVKEGTNSAKTVQTLDDASRMLARRAHTEPQASALADRLRASDPEAQMYVAGYLVPHHPRAARQLFEQGIQATTYRAELERIIRHLPADPAFASTATMAQRRLVFMPLYPK